MLTPVLPNIIRGSGIVLVNGVVDYWKGSLAMAVSRPSFNIDADMFGNVSARSSGNPMVDITYTPVGMLKNFAAHYPYGPHSLVAASSIGKSIFGANPVACAVATVAGDVYTWQRGATYSSPSMYLGPKKTIFGPKTMRVLSRIDVPQTTANALVAIAQQAFADASFDPTKIVNDMYVAALGTRGAPWNAMGARTGFEVVPEYVMEDAPDDYVGIADTYLKSVRWKVRFAPNNLTLAQVMSLANYEGAQAIQVGQPIPQGNGGGYEDLVIEGTGTGNVFTVHAVGVEKSDHGVGISVDRNGTVAWTQDMSFNAGVPNSLITLPNL